jgi:deoxyadenosine/deoxycytidine kinase
MDNIKKRGRDYEQQMDPNYLLKIQQAYFDFFRTVKDIPIVVLDVQSIDFVQNPEHYQSIVQLLQQSFPAGMHQLKAEDLLSKKLS